MKINRNNKLLISLITILILAFAGFYYLISLFLPVNPTISDLKKIGFGYAKSIYSSIFYHVNEGSIEGYSSRINPKNGMTQVFVPGGEFLMGADDGKSSKNHPLHKITIDSFWIDQIEVTNNLYKKCAAAGKCKDPLLLNPYYSKTWFDSYPVVYISWEQAKNYCQWVDSDLPTEAEWEKAARGTEGAIYPWGDNSPGPTLTNYDNNIGMLVSAYTYRAGISPYGALNMAGNAREWVKDWFNDTFYSRTPSDNPAGAPAGRYKSLRGGSYLDDGAEISSYNRFFHEPGSAGINRGFRCVKRIPK